MSARARLLAAALLSAPISTAAQQWHFDAQAGAMRSPLDPAGTATSSGLVGLRFENPRTSLRLVTGIPTSSQQAHWGSAAGAHRLLAGTGAFKAGIDLSAHAFLLRGRAQPATDARDVIGRRTVVPQPAQNGHAAAAQALPLISLQADRVFATVRAGLSHFTSEFPGTTRARTVGVADLQVNLLATAALAITPALKRVHAQEADYSFVGVSALTGSARARAWGSAGQWLGQERGFSWAAGTTVDLHSRIAVSASARQDGLDPLYLNSAQTSWNVGVSVALGDRPAGAPVPAAYSAGKATIRLKGAAAAPAPQIAGDFNDWQPRPMERAGAGWSYTVAVAPGVYNYAFVDERGAWFVPEKHPGRKSDGMGGHVAVLVVR